MKHQVISTADAHEVQIAELPFVSIVMPCLNETVSLPHCIAQATRALALIQDRFGLDGEIVIADNGSTDGSQDLATSLGARVVPIAQRGYGSALIGGCHAAYGQYILMGDADGSYDFTEGVEMIAKLADGHDVCMGSRFKGGIKPGAMPWKNRYIGNPALTGILNLFFRSGISDAHCGLRAIRKDAFERLNLTSTGMEFASEMVIKASLLKLRMAEVPASLSPDLRERAPHLRPWRDGWRHLRYLLMLSPTWVYGVPALLALTLGLSLLLGSGVEFLYPGTVPQIGPYWTLLGSAFVDIGHLALLLALSAHLYGIRSGYKHPTIVTRIARRIATLESMLLAGLTTAAAGMGILMLVAIGWVARHFTGADSILPPVVGILALTIGMQNILGGFLLAIIGGNEAKFFASSHVPQNRHPNG